MAGVIDSLGTGSVVLDGGNRILACSESFARMVHRSQSELVGSYGWDLVKEQDRLSGKYFMENHWKSGESFTIVSHLIMPSGEPLLFESFVQRLVGMEANSALSIIRPFVCRHPSELAEPKAAKAMAGYVADMSFQLADMAAAASLPVTCDLLNVAADVGVREGALETIIQARR